MERGDFIMFTPSLEKKGRQWPQWGLIIIARITTIKYKIAETANFSNNHRNTWTNTRFDVCTESQVVTVIKTAQYWYKDKNTDK